MGLKKALAKKMEEELALVEQLPLDELLAMEIAHDWEPWLERAKIHLEAKLKKANQYLDLQRRMTKHYARRNQIARAKLKKAQDKLQALKEERGQARLGILAQSSLQVSQNPWGTHPPNLGEFWQVFVIC